MKQNKKVVRQTIEEALTQAILTFDLKKLSKKSVKLIKEASRKISEQIKADLKKTKKKKGKIVDVPKKTVRKNEG